MNTRGISFLITALAAISLVGCSSGVAPTASTAAPSATQAAPSSAASAASPSQAASPSVAQASPSDDATTVVEPSTSPEPALKVAWERSGPKPSQPCAYSPAVDSAGHIWVAVCWDSRFWIFDQAGKFLESWGTHGTGPGQLDFAYPANHDSIGGIAFAPDGTFYTFDGGNLRVQHFDKTRKFIGSWGSFGSGDGQFAKPTSITVDGRGHVFVADGIRADAQEFTADGTFVRVIGSGAINTTGFAYIAADKAGNLFGSEGHNVARFGPDGSVSATYDIGAIADIVSGMAVSGSGSLFVLSRADDGPQATTELDPEGEILHVWPGTGETLALDPKGKAAYVADVDWPFLRKYELPAG